MAAWEEFEAEQKRKAAEKREKKIYGNWKTLIRGLLIRERLRNRYGKGESHFLHEAAAESRAECFNTIFFAFQSIFQIHFEVMVMITCQSLWENMWAKKEKFMDTGFIALTTHCINIFYFMITHLIHSHLVVKSSLFLLSSYRARHIQIHKNQVDQTSLVEIVRLSDWSCPDHLSSAAYLHVSVELWSSINTWLIWSILPSIVLQSEKKSLQYRLRIRSAKTKHPLWSVGQMVTTYWSNIHDTSSPSTSPASIFNSCNSRTTSVL